MANTTEAHWDEGSPIITEPRRSGAAEILSLRKAVRQRMSKEHDTLAASSAGGEHKAGSAKAYHQSTAPTLRPDGTTSLSADDAGRLWVDSDDDKLYKWNGTAWEDLKAVALIAQFEKNNSAALPSLPFTQTGLTNGTWIVWLYGASDYTDNTAPLTISATINGITRTLYLANQPDGNAPFMIPFHITVSGGSCSLTATSGISWLGTMSGFITVPS